MWWLLLPATSVPSHCADNRPQLGPKHLPGPDLPFPLRHTTLLSNCAVLWGSGESWPAAMGVTEHVAEGSFGAPRSHF